MLQIEGVGGFSDLRLLELGSNRLRRIAGLDHMTRLQELWLGRNRIAAIEGLSQCGCYSAAKPCQGLYRRRDLVQDQRGGLGPESGLGA